MKSKSISTFSKFLSVFLSVLIVAYTVPVSVYADLIDEIREMHLGIFR